MKLANAFLTRLVSVQRDEPLFNVNVFVAGKPAGLNYDSSGNVVGAEDPGARRVEGLLSGFDVLFRRCLESPNDSKFAFPGLLANGKPERNERVGGPVEKARWKTVMLGDGQPLPRVTYRSIEVWESLSTEIRKKLTLCFENVRQ